jgi:hypothetical protein
MLLAVKATHTMPTNRATYLRNSRPLTFRGARGAFEAGVSVARDFVDTLCNIGKHAVRANPSQTLHPRCVGIGRYGQPPRSGIACQQTYHNDSIFGETVVFPHMDRPNAEVTKSRRDRTCDAQPGRSGRLRLEFSAIDARGRIRKTGQRSSNFLKHGDGYGERKRDVAKL